MIDYRSQLVVDVEPMSDACSKCAQKTPHKIELCPKDVDCSSKAMEAIGSARTAQNLFTDCWTNMRTRGTENPDAFIRLNIEYD
jgi:hypothetical protein